VGLCEFDSFSISVKPEHAVEGTRCDILRPIPPTSKSLDDGLKDTLADPGEVDLSHTGHRIGDTLGTDDVEEFGEYSGCEMSAKHGCEWTLDLVETLHDGNE
jgi:hypothetical protein